VTIPQSTVRVSFAIPWEGMLLLGTTDTLHEGEPEAAAVTDEDVQAILAEARVAIHGLDGPVRASFCGLRVLPGGPGSTAKARRETVYTRGPTGMLSVAGGKLTTYRRIALDALAMLRAELDLHRIDRRPFPVPGAVDRLEGARRLARRWPDLDPRVRTHLLDHYGGLAEQVLAPAEEKPDLLRPIHPDGPDIVAQAVYARDVEWARTPDDVLRRRTTVTLRGLASEEAVAVVEELQLGVRNLDRRPRPLPGAVGLARVAWPVELPPATRRHLLHLYGSLAADVVRPAVGDVTLLEPIVDGCLDLRAQELYARREEWALTDEDVLRRRTTVWVHGDPSGSSVDSR
ncbi:MAG TPA: glycerol-3-phosphate dehydrogenase C-terminal domain-containing protein, partial [Solirubrobacteraceae bacterium]|nr:glycerol-3-phosphate dehydrogenase C-terminal domain-containing protein [Solirubrobacteraceae bacterium]